MYRAPRRLRYALHLITVCTILPFCVILGVLYRDPQFNARLKQQTRAPPLRVYRDAEDEAILCVIPNVFQYGGGQLLVPDVYEKFGNELADCLRKRNIQYYSGAAPGTAKNVRRYDVDVLGQSFTSPWYHHFSHLAVPFPQKVLVPASFLLPYPDAQLPTPTCFYPDDPAIQSCENGRYTLQPRILISKHVLGSPGGWVYEMLRLVTTGTTASIFTPQFLHVAPASAGWESFRALVTSPQRYDIERNDRLMQATGISRAPKCTRRVVIVVRDRRKKLDRTIPAATLRALRAELARAGNLTVDTVVDMGHLTFAQQVNLMQDTDVLLAVHGAEMSNILFLRAGARVIEIHPFGYWVSNMFYPIRTALHLNYTGLSSAPDRAQFLRCMKDGKQDDPEIARGIRIFRAREKMYRVADDDWGRWRAGAFWMLPSWARRCCRAQVIDFDATEIAQLVLRHARSRCNETVAGR